MKTVTKKILPIAAITLPLLALSGCGGGSDNKMPPLEGAYAGSFSNGVVVTDIVFKDGSLWRIYGNKDTEAIQGFSAGNVKSDDGRFTLTFIDFPEPGDKPAPGDGSGVYTSSSATGTVTAHGQTLNLNVSTIPEKNYVYKAHASISPIVGSWSGKALDGKKTDIEILADGIFSGSTEQGCKFSGKIAPKGNINAFDVTTIYGGQPCVLTNQTVTGIGFKILGDDGKNRLFFAGTTPAKNVGTVFYAAR